jgi:hypothetical protein
VSALVRDDGRELVRLFTGHWPMISQPRELARVPRESATGA